MLSRVESRAVRSDEPSNATTFIDDCSGSSYAVMDTLLCHPPTAHLNPDRYRF
jgi:hypothetical protein